MEALSGQIEALRDATAKDMEILGHRLRAKMERGFRRQTVWIVSVLLAQSGLHAWLLSRVAGG